MTAFAIYDLAAGQGRLGLSPAPGANGDYAGDLAKIRNWRPDLVISAVTLDEMAALGCAGFARDLGAIWRHFPIADYQVPDADGDAAWPALASEALAVCRRGGRVLTHCRGGCGRSGMIALRLMRGLGAGTLEDLRAVRPCAVETDAQLVWASS